MQYATTTPSREFHTAASIRRIFRAFDNNEQARNAFITPGSLFQHARACSNDPRFICASSSPGKPRRKTKYSGCVCEKRGGICVRFFLRLPGTGTMATPGQLPSRTMAESPISKKVGDQYINAGFGELISQAFHSFCVPREVLPTLVTELLFPISTTATRPQLPHQH
jgi:hypothetical protein